MILVFFVLSFGCYFHFHKRLFQGGLRHEVFLLQFLQAGNPFFFFLHV